MTRVAKVTTRCDGALLQLQRAVAVKAHRAIFGLACGGIWFDCPIFAVQNTQQENISGPESGGVNGFLRSPPERTSSKLIRIYSS
jgi:hypothetical protein